MLDQSPESSSGEQVTAKDMLGYPPAFHCINKIAGHVGYLPLNLYERDRTDERKKKLAEKLPAYWLVKCQPNPLMSPLVMRQTMQAHALWSGNGRAYIQRNLRGEPIGLWPLPPARCSTVLVTIDGNDTDMGTVAEGDIVQKWHLFRKDDGRKIPIPDRDVLHIPGLGYDGIQGYSVIDLAREWLGQMKAENKAVGSNLKNGGRPGVILTAPPGVFKTEADAKAWLANFNATHAGAGNDGKASLMTGGMDAKTLVSSAKESQWQEQRIFSRQDAAIWFSVEQMLGDDSSVSYRSLEEKNRAYVTNCLVRWLTIWEQECWAKLLTTQQREGQNHYFRFVLAALLRGSLLDRYQAYAIAKQNEFMSTNDIRENEDMDAIDGGDEYVNPIINTKGKSTSGKEEHDDAKALAAKLKLVVSSRLREIQHTEANRVQQAAAASGNFCEWVESFYSSASFGGRLETTWECVGLSAASAADYADESKRQLLDAAGTNTQENLPAAVSRIVATWPNRAAQLAAIAVGE
jgi:HK97 family phage portal protein